MCNCIKGCVILTHSISWTPTWCEAQWASYTFIDESQVAVFLHELLRKMLFCQIVDSGLKEVWLSRESADWHYRLRIMSSAGREIIGWRWLEAGWTTGEHPPIPLWGWCPWKPVVGTLRRGHSTITNAPLMPVNDRRVTVWFLGKRKKKTLSPFFFLWLSYWIFFLQGICVSHPR